MKMLQSKYNCWDRTSAVVLTMSHPRCSSLTASSPALVITVLIDSSLRQNQVYSHRRGYHCPSDANHQPGPGDQPGGPGEGMVISPA